MMYPRHGHSAEALGGKIYVFGGQEYSENSKKYCMEVYDPEWDEWNRLDQPANLLHSASTTY